MAYALIWTAIGRDDLDEIVRYISLDSQRRAEAFAIQIVQQIERLKEHPTIGQRIAHEELANLRQLLIRPYRVIYQINDAKRMIAIIRIWHGARGALRIEE